MAIKLQKPLYYENQYGLRFEIGPENEPIWLDDNRHYVNERYLDVALQRAVEIFQSSFSKNDKIDVVYQIWSNGRQKIKKNNYLFKQIKNLKEKKVLYSKHREIYTDCIDFKCQHTQRVTIKNLSVNDLNVKNILIAIINHDFGDRLPRLPEECFFINCTTGLILHLYDDQGMDVVANDKKVLFPIYEKHHDLLLEHNREDIEKTFV